MRRNPRLHRNVQVQRHLSEILVRESNGPRFQRVTVSRVEASKDMSFAKVFVSVFPSESKAELVESLNHAAGFFSRHLGQRLTNRLTPRLLFVFDEGFDHSLHIDELLRKDAANHPASD